MRNLVNFFLKIGELKRYKRRGWVLHKIKNPETVADHIFRSAIFAWVLNKKKGFNEEIVIKMALAHDLCEVYAEDQTPYDPLLPKKINLLNQGKIGRTLNKWPKFSPADKRKKVLNKHREESKALNKLIQKLPFSIRQEIRQLWVDFDQRKTKEGRFVHQIDKAENFLQGLEYWKSQGKIRYKLWDRWAKEIFDDKILLDFKRTIDKNFFEKKSKAKRAKKQKSKKSKDFMEQALDFLIKVGELKKTKQEKWMLRKAKKPDTIAQHSFRVAIMVWLLSNKRELNVEKALKIALIHDLCDLKGCHESLCDVAFINSSVIQKITNKNSLKIFPRLSQKKKLEWFQRNRRKEQKCLKNLISSLPKFLQEEIVNLWIDFTEGLSKEGRFVKQVAKIEGLLQAMEYWQADKHFPIKLWWVEIKEAIDHPLLKDIVQEIDKKFYQKKFL